MRKICQRQHHTHMRNWILKSPSLKQLTNCTLVLQFNNSKFSTDSNVNFTDEATFDSMLTMHTFAKYDKKYVLTTPRVLVKDIKKPTLDPWRIPKMDGAGPGSYNSPAAFDKT